MHPKRAQKLRFVVTLVIGVALIIGLLLYAFRQNINHFYPPEAIVKGEAPVGAKIRVGGLVVEGSVKRDDKTLAVAFDVTDTIETVTIHYVGILPDLFREGQGIIARGELKAGGIVEAEEVLAKHDENYMPPEVMESIQAAKQKALTQQAGASK